MIEAGFNMVFVGIETPDEETLRATGKLQNVRAGVFRSVETLQRAGLEVSSGFILGFDTDPEDIFDRQIEAIRRSAIPVAMVGLLSALPGTQLAKRLEREGRLRGTVEGNNVGSQLAMDFQPKMDERRLVNGYVRVLRSIYRPKAYFERCLELIRRMPRRPTAGGSVSPAELRAFFRSLLWQSFSRYGPFYLSFLARVLLRRPLRVPDAVALAVRGHHFFRMTADLAARHAEGRQTQTAEWVAHQARAVAEAARYAAHAGGAGLKVATGAFTTERR
jgi:hypothetical protein